MSQAIEISIESADESPSEDPRQRSHTLRVLSPRKIRGERSKSPNPRQMPRNDSDNDNDDAVSDSKDPKDDGGLSADAKRDWRQSLRISRFSGNFNFTRPSSQSKTLRDLDFEPPTTPSRCASFAELIDGMGFEALQKMAKSQIQQIEELKQKLHLQEMANSSFSEEAREFSQPTMAGWMQKQGHLRKTWLRRFFILQGNQLIYQYEIKGPVKRSYMLDQVSVEVIDYQGLETIQLTSEGVVSYLRAESPDTNSTWMHYIESQIAYSRYLEKMRTLNIPADPRVKRYFQKIHSGSLALDNCILRPETAEALLVPFKSTCFLQRLSLINAGIDETNIIEVCKAIQANNSLVMISLDDNSINDEGVILLSRAIRVKETVATVSLKQNKISAIGFARFMVHSFENRSLAEVNFSFNQITSDGFRKLYDLVEQAPEFQPGSLYKLIIHRNDITSEVRICHLCLNLSPNFPLSRGDNNAHVASLFQF
eukprot:TRINITY_DN8833_c0_g1_i1.p1 TRINITY_DN8833_c0_g1~~TRINITY_DN8833_c0_g1_i1.p1  ORF type:complete len:482 (-),score=69.87 TRINITY_DN8833_c0_g1_i1:439-1884(-)